MKKKILAVYTLGLLVMTSITAFSVAGTEQKLELVKEKSTTLLSGPVLRFYPESNDFGEVAKNAKAREPFTFTLKNEGDQVANFKLSDAPPYFTIKGIHGDETLTRKGTLGATMKIKVHFNTWPATGSFDGYIKAEGNNCYAQAYVCGESVRGDSEDSPIHQRPFNLLERMLLLKNILILLRS